jgi:hypothetical protein
MRLEIRETNTSIPDSAAPMPAKRRDFAKDQSSANLGFEAKLWLDADKSRNPPFNDSDTALRACALPQSEATMQVVSEAKDNSGKDDDVRWQWSGATWTTEGFRQGERRGVHHSESRPGAAAIRSR